MINNLKKLRSLGIHDGVFHADEVTAAALLIFFHLVDENLIIRTRDGAKLSTCDYVCDVGGIYDPEKKLFDHHQAEYQGMMSSAGMVLLYLKERQIMSLDEYHLFNNSLIIGIDDHDNGRARQEVGYCSFSHVIANFNPITYELTAKDQLPYFLQALHFVLGHLERLKKRHDYAKECQAMVAEAMSAKKPYLFFPKAIPWQENFFMLGGLSHPALFVVMPSGDHWKVRAIPPDYEHRMETRLALPEKWGGLSDEALQKVTGIPGAIFCHKGGFTSVWRTKEDAREALKVILKSQGVDDEIHF